MAALRREGFLSYTPYVAGQTIYGNGSFAPTAGPVDPSGYLARDVQRQARNRVKRNTLLEYAKKKQAGEYSSAGFLRKA